MSLSIDNPYISNRNSQITHLAELAQLLLVKSLLTDGRVGNRCAEVQLVWGACHTVALNNLSHTQCLPFDATSRLQRGAIE